MILLWVSFWVFNVVLPFSIRSKVSNGFPDAILKCVPGDKLGSRASLAWLSCEDAKLLTGGRLPGTNPFSFISWSRDQLSLIMKTVLFWKFCWQELEKHIKIRYPQEPITLVSCKILVFHRNPCKVRNFQTVVKYKKSITGLQSRFYS